MRITDVEAIPLLIPVRETEPLPQKTTAMRPPSNQYVVLVKISTDEGITGYGEAWRIPPGAISSLIREVLKPLLIGEDPMRLERLWDLMYRATFRLSGKGLVLHGISGIEIALWDIIGKYRNLPVYEMLGGLYHDKIRAYVNFPHYLKLEDYAVVSTRAVEEGFTALKYHLRSLSGDTKSIDAGSVLGVARDAVGYDITIMADFSCAWTPKEAVEQIKRLEKYELLWVEEPVWPADDYDGLAYVRDKSNIPIATGENEYTHYGFKEIIMKQAADIVQPDIIRAGGLMTCRKIQALAEAFNLQTITHSPFFGPGLAATVHFCLSNKTSDFIEISGVRLTESLMQPSLLPEKGYIKPPDKPGLGIDIDESIVRNFPYPGI